MPAILYHYALIEPYEAFYGCKFVFKPVSIEVIDGVKGIIFVFSDGVTSLATDVLYIYAFHLHLIIKANT